MTPDPIPFQNFVRAQAPYQRELEEAAVRVLRAGRYIMGDELAAFEEEFARFCGKRFCVGVGNGLDALTLALTAGVKDVRPGDEAIVPAHTFAATWLAASRCGLKPVAVDVDERRGTMNEAAAEMAVTPRTRAIVPVHLHGFAAPGARLAAVAKERGIFLLEDAAQAHGQAGAGYGDAMAFSFYPTKNLGGYGDGGAVVTDDEELATRVALLRNYGRRDTANCSLMGANSRLDEMQAALLRVRLRYLPEEIAIRRKIARHYLSEIANPKISLPGDGHTPEERAASGVWHLFPVRCGSRDALRGHLLARGIQALVHYPLLPCEQSCYRDAPGSFALAGEAAQARAWARTTLSLPLWPGLSFSDLERVVSACNEFAG